MTDPSGLLQLGARFYWPEIGRFIQQDPIRDDINWYAYAANNPLLFIDPEGRSWRDVWETLKALGSYQGSWRAWFSPRCTGSGAYFGAYARGMIGWPSGLTNLPTAYNAKGLGPLWTARTYYRLTDKRFTAWGRYSRVLAPNAVARISPWASRASALSTAALFPQSMYYMSKSADVLVWKE